MSEQLNITSCCKFLSGTAVVLLEHSSFITSETLLFIGRQCSTEGADALHWCFADKQFADKTFRWQDDWMTRWQDRNTVHKWNVNEMSCHLNILSVNSVSKMSSYCRCTLQSYQADLLSSDPASKLHKNMPFYTNSKNFLGLSLDPSRPQPFSKWNCTYECTPMAKILATSMALFIVL